MTVDFKSPHMENWSAENHHTNDDNVIARKVKSAVKEMVTKELLTMVERLLDAILRILFHNVQDGTWSGEYNSIDQAMLALLREDVFEKR